MKIFRNLYVLFFVAAFCYACSTPSPKAVKHRDNLRITTRNEAIAKYNLEKMSDVVASMDIEKVQNFSALEAEEPEAEPIVEDAEEYSSSGTSDKPEASGPNDENGNAETKEQVMLDTALNYCEAAQDLWTAGNSERAIETLDEAYHLVLRVDTDKHPEMIQQKEDMRFTISKRILEIYSSRFTTANGNHKEIPLTMNEHVEREIKSFQGYEREFFMEGYKRSGKYREAIVQSLKEAGMPEELVWLPFIESWFKVNALSP
ncbi:MAG: hypothetical protein C4538_01605, partial [Nitrospiraceae bacterium]